ncbi:MAG: 3-dehydroquinate synthase family protein, partial [Gemmatimonadota bacterium]
GDLGGFVAATYMRGVPVVQVPTSLLAMLDSSVGGKTGIDTHAAKNSIGVFHHPAFVLIDPELLATLPRHQRLAGLAEAVKAAAVADEELFGWIEENSSALRDGATETLGELITWAVTIKAAVVEDDPLEQGRRAILNFGHTAGHALEAASEYGLLHGEAVAIGMRLESLMGESAGTSTAGTAERLNRLLDSLDIGCEAAAEHTAEELLRLAESDKKARQGSVRWVFLDSIGSVATDADGEYTHSLGAEECTRLLGDALRGLTSEADSTA